MQQAQIKQLQPTMVSMLDDYFEVNGIIYTPAEYTLLQLVKSGVLQNPIMK